jgi:hypothetical protein
MSSNDLKQDSMKTHTIHWKSLINGKIGTGTFLFEKEEAECLAEELNRDYPGIHHEAVMDLPLPIQTASLPPVEMAVPAAA